MHSKKTPGVHYAWLDPESALNIGFALHVMDDPHRSRHTHAREVAEKTIRPFLTLEAEPGSADEAYLTSVRACVLSFSQGIRRCKERCLAELGAAEREYENARRKIHDEKQAEVWFELVRKAASFTVLTVIGYWIAQRIAPHVPEAIAHFTGNRLPGVMLGLTLAASFSLARNAWYEYRNAKALERYQYREHVAMREYSRNKLREHRLHRPQLARLWSAYTGEPCPVEPTYLLAIEDDVHWAGVIDRHLNGHRHPSLLQSILRSVRRRRAAKRVALA